MWAFDNHCCDECSNPLDRGYRVLIDRHGDKARVCMDCYTRAMQPRPFGTFEKWVSAIMLLLAVAIVSLAMAGCATIEPHTERVMVGDRLVTIVTDDPSAPEECGNWSEPWVGCWMGQFSTIYLKSPVSLATVEHELSHAAGMFHGEWKDYPVIGKRCAEVILSGGKYKAGQMICLDSRTGTEEIWSDRNFTKLERATV